MENFSKVRPGIKNKTVCFYTDLEQEKSKLDLDFFSSDDNSTSSWIFTSSNAPGIIDKPMNLVNNFIHQLSNKTDVSFKTFNNERVKSTDVPVIVITIHAQYLDYSSLFKGIKNYLLERQQVVNHPKFKLLLIYVTEGWINPSHNPIVDCLHELQSQPFLKGKIIYSSGALNFEKKYIEKYPNDSVVFFSYPWFWIWSSKNFIQKTAGSYQPGNNRIMCFNRRVHPHRVLLALELESLKILDKISLSLPDQINGQWPMSFDGGYQSLCDDAARHGMSINYPYDSLKKKLPLVVDTADFEFNHIDTFSDHTHESHPINVVTETLFMDNEIFFTEKMFKPIWFGQIFILANGYQSLKELQKMGFKTFQNVGINESYDSIECPFKRMHAIAEEINRIARLSEKEFEQIRTAAKPIIEYNRTYFKNQKAAIDICYGRIVDYLSSQ